MKIRILCTILLFALPSVPVFADSFSTYGDVTTVTPGPGGQPSAFHIVANPAASGFGGLQKLYTTLITPGALTNLNANYQWLTGPFGGGAPQAPRFSLADTSFNSAYLYWGTNGATVADPNGGSYGNTGNLASLAGTKAYVVSDGFGGFTNSSPVTWAQFVAQVGGVAITDISLDIDGPSGFDAATNTTTQIANVTSFTINDTTYRPATTAPTPEPSSLLLLGTGVLSAAGLLFRRRVTA